jgi:hypothetical protein
MRMTDTHVYFVGGPFSQWAPSLFKARFEPDTDEFDFNCAEQYMMAAKAFLMKDFASLEAILGIQPKGGNAAFFAGGARAPFFDVPKAQKAAGRAVKNFDAKLWDARCEHLVFVGNFAKFTQNPSFREALLATGNRTIVEGASYDRIWGVGLDWADPQIEDEANWRGENRLGRVVMAVREVLAADPTGFDPFVRAYGQAA